MVLNKANYNNDFKKGSDNGNAFFLRTDQIYTTLRFAVSFSPNQCLYVVFLLFSVRNIIKIIRL